MPLNFYKNLLHSTSNLFCLKPLQRNISSRNNERVSLPWTWNYGWLTIKSFFILSPNDYHLMTVLLLNQFVSNIALLYPWRNRKPYGFLMWCFPWVKKYNNGYKLVNMTSKYCLGSSKISHKLGLFLTAGNIFRSRLMRQLTLHL